jgi:hypothetical protein
MSVWCVLVVLVCAFSPSFPTAKIAVAVQVFVAATRSRADDLIVVLAINASDVQEQVAASVESVDDHVRYVSGVPYSEAALKVGSISGEYDYNCVWTCVPNHCIFKDVGLI